MKVKLLKHLRSKYQIIIEEDSVSVLYKVDRTYIRIGNWKPSGSVKELHAELEVISLEHFYEWYKKDWYIRLTDNVKILFK